MFRGSKIAAAFLAFGLLVLAIGCALKSGKLQFTDAQSQSLDFIRYYHSISLSPSQQQVKERVLGSIPAACCKDRSSLTCCCPCNFAKSVWGLSNYLISRLHYSDEDLRKAVTAWIAFTHPNGHEGDSCYKGRCSLPFAKDGCGGMRESNLVF